MNNLSVKCDAVMRDHFNVITDKACTDILSKATDRLSHSTEKMSKASFVTRWYWKYRVKKDMEKMSKAVKCSQELQKLKFSKEEKTPKDADTFQYLSENNLKSISFDISRPSCLVATFESSDGNKFQFTSSTAKVIEHIRKTGHYEDNSLIPNHLILAHFRNMAKWWYTYTHVQVDID